jgi:serine/threonine protein kinase
MPVQDSAMGMEQLRGIAFAAGEQLIMATARSGLNSSSERLVLQVEQFTARGGIADLYKVKLLQQPASGTPTAQPAAAAAAGTAEPAATPLSGAANLQRAAAVHKGGASLQQQLSIGQTYALKVVRSLDTYPASLVQTSHEAYMQEMRKQLKREWQVLQDLATCRNIINAYRFGRVTAAGAAVSTAECRGAAAGSSSKEQQHQQTSPGQCQQQHELGSTHAALGAPAAAVSLPCILMEFADGGCAWDAVYKQPGGPMPLPADEAWKLVYGVTEGLHGMHSQSYIHRDVKLQNVLKVSGRFGSR